MPTKPCLIFSNYPLLPTDGGPSGFLTQNVMPASSPYFHLGGHHGGPFLTRWERLRGRLRGEPNRTFTRMGLARNSFYATWLCRARHYFACEKAESYPWIWFHDVINMGACLDLLRPDQKIILQPHCPELPSEEEAAQEKRQPDDIAWVRAAERRAFARADFVVLPNEQTRAIYAPLLRKDQRIEYLPSACRAMSPRAALPLDPAFIYFLYIGRRNSVKGFDLIMEAFRRTHVQNPKTRLLLIGNGPVERGPGVLDIGFSQEPAIWVAACDYFVSANRRSYFDLSVMEALSLGTPLIIACTGGHEEFGRIKSPGILAMPEAAVEPLTQAFLESRRKRPDNQPSVEANLRLYNERFSDRLYRERLDALLARLIGEKASA